MRAVPTFPQTSITSCVGASFLDSRAPRRRARDAVEEGESRHPRRDQRESEAIPGVMWGSGDDDPVRSPQTREDPLARRCLRESARGGWTPATVQDKVERCDLRGEGEEDGHGEDGDEVQEREQLGHRGRGVLGGLVVEL